MKRAALLILAAVIPLACGDTDTDGGREAVTEDSVPEVHPVDLDTVAWFTEGRTVEFDDRTWLVAGEPVIDPVVERVGEFEGTPLYAEVNVSPPYNELFVPLEDDYWQMLEEGPMEPSDTVPVDSLMADTDTTPGDSM